MNETPEKEGKRPVLVYCHACGADVSRTCLAGILTLPSESRLVVFSPLRCPECNTPMSFVSP